MATPLTAQGAKLWRSTDSGSTYTEIVDCYTIGTPSQSSERLESTTLTDTSKTYVGGLADPNQVSFGVMFDGADAMHQALLADNAAGTEQTWLIEVPEPGGTAFTTYEFDGYVSEFAGSLDVNTVVRYTGTIIQAAGATIAHAQVAQT